jgi:hypothetical protein
MSHSSRSLPADAFFNSDSPIPRLMTLIPTYKKVNEERLFWKESLRTQSFSDEDLKVLHACEAYLKQKLQFSASSARPTSCAAILDSVEAQRKLWKKLQESLETVYDQGLKTETFYGPTPTMVRIQWLVRDGENGQESSVDNIPVLLLQLYNMFNVEQKLWGLYFGGEKVEEASSESESESGDTEDTLPKELTEFLSRLSCEKEETKHVCVALATVECRNDWLNSHIETQTDFTGEREDAALSKVDTMTAHFNDVRTSVEVARCTMPQKLKEKAHPDGDVSSVPTTASDVSGEGKETKRSKEIAGSIQTLPTCHPMYLKGWYLATVSSSSLSLTLFDQPLIKDQLIVLSGPVSRSANRGLYWPY